MDPYDVQHAHGVPAEDSTMESPAQQPQMKEEPKSNRVRWRYEIPPRDPALPPRTRKPKAEIFIDYSTRRSNKGGGKDTVARRKRNRKTRRKVTESSGNVAELSHGHHTRPEDEDETTEPLVDGISSDGLRFRDFVPELMESRTRSAGLSSSGHAPQPPPPARRQRAPKRKRAAQGRGAKRNVQDQVEEDNDGAPTPAPSQPSGAVVARLGGPEGIVLIPRHENMGPVSANENRPMKQRLGENAKNGQDAPNSDQNAQEPAPPQRNRNQEEDSHDVELTDAPYDDQNAQYDPRLDFEQHLQHENQVMEQAVNEDAAQHIRKPAQPVQVAENQVAGSDVAGNEQKQPSRALTYRYPHLEEEAEEEPVPLQLPHTVQTAENEAPGQGAGNGMAGNENLPMKQPPRAGELAVDDNELADRIHAPAPPPQQNWNQVKLEPNVDIKIEVEEHGLFDMDNQALGNVVGEVGEVDEEDVVLEEFPARNLVADDDDDDIMLLPDQPVQADPKAQHQDPRRAIPGRLETNPDKVVKFNAPFEISQAVNIQIRNRSNQRIAFNFTSDSNRLEFHPPFGIVEDRGGRAYVQIVTKVFRLRPGDTDRILIEWMNGPRHGNAEPNYFFEGGIKDTKKLVVEYNSS